MLSVSYFQTFLEVFILIIISLYEFK